MWTLCVVEPHFVLLHAQVLGIRTDQLAILQLSIIQLLFKVGYQEFMGTTGGSMWAKIAELV
jgi:hypothetical protein